MYKAVTFRRALLIAPRFFGYEKEIAAELEQHGLQVDMLPDRPFDSPYFKAMMRLWPKFGGYQISDRFFTEKLHTLGRDEYEIILVILGEGVTPRTLSQLRIDYPRARLIYYTWDSIKNKPSFQRNLELYDHCFTFDHTDAKRYGMTFRPLFYLPDFDKPIITEPDYDLSFIGTIHSDRYKIIRSLTKQLPSSTNFFTYLYLQAPWMYDLRRIFTNTIAGAKRNEFQYLPLSKDLVRSVFFGSRAVVDIEHPNQSGATIRTFEAIGSQRKLITTNATLRNYDFYNPMNIQIISRQVPLIDFEFLRAPYVPLPISIKKKYSLSQWLRDVCDI